MRTGIIISEEQAAFCKAMSFLFWWKKPDELADQPHRTLAGVMDRGGVGEWLEMERLFSRKFIIEAIESAKCGEFHGWSWKFWRLRYGLDGNAPLPARLPGGPAPDGGFWFTGLQRRKSVKNEEYERLKWTFAVRNMEEPDGAQIVG